MVRVRAATEGAYELATSLAPFPKALKQNAMVIMARSHCVWDCVSRCAVRGKRRGICDLAYVVLAKCCHIGKLR